MIQTIMIVVYLHRCRSSSMRTYMCEIRSLLFSSAFSLFPQSVLWAFMLSPLSEQLNKMNLIMGQVWLFPSPHLGCSILSFSINQSCTEYNYLLQSQGYENIEGRHRAAIAQVREQEGCHICPGFIDWDCLHVTACVPHLLVALQ